MKWAGVLSSVQRPSLGNCDQRGRRDPHSAGRRVSGSWPLPVCPCHHDGSNVGRAAQAVRHGDPAQPQQEQLPRPHSLPTSRILGWVRDCLALFHLKLWLGFVLGRWNSRTEHKAPLRASKRRSKHRGTCSTHVIKS